MNKFSGTVNTSLIFLAFVISACSLGPDVEAMATQQAAQVALAVAQTQAAAQATELAGIKLTQAAVPPTAANSPTPLPSFTPQPTWTAVPPTVTPTRLPTSTNVPTIAAAPSSGSTTGSTVPGYVCYASKMDNGMESIRVENNSGQRFTILMRCSGSICLDHTDVNYACTFDQGVNLFWIWPGRYNITWTICAETESFVHVLNSQWYIKLRKCD